MTLYKDTRPDDVERVARAIFRAGFHPDDPQEIVDEKWSEWADGRRRSFKQADAAIAALSTERPTVDVGWELPSVAPSVPLGGGRYFQVAVRRAHSGQVYSFPAQYLNAMRLEFEEGDPSERECTGWYSAECEGNDGDIYRPVLSERDELMGWHRLPDWNDAAALTTLSRPVDATKLAPS